MKNIVKQTTKETTSEEAKEKTKFKTQLEIQREKDKKYVRMEAKRLVLKNQMDNSRDNTTVQKKKDRQNNYMLGVKTETITKGADKWVIERMSQAVFASEFAFGQDAGMLSCPDPLESIGLTQVSLG